MEALQHILIFAGQTAIVVTAIAVLMILVALLIQRSNSNVELQVDRLDQRIHRMGQRLRAEILPRKEARKQFKAEHKSEKKSQAKSTTFVIEFKGDLKAGAVDCLREEVTAILQSQTKDAEVIVRLESPGGVVHGYGLGAAQLMRLKAAGLKLTVCIDKVAASGGYMMACIADRILAAPFAIVGSIGVVAQVPNAHRLLKKWDIDYKEYTAGEFKRTVSFLGEITPKGEAKFLEQLEDTHVLFKNFVSAHRPQLELSKVATGEYWYGEQALQLQLIDGISTSDDLIAEHSKNRRVLRVKFEKKQSVSEKLSGMAGHALHKTSLKVLQDLEAKRWL